MKNKHFLFFVFTVIVVLVLLVIRSSWAMKISAFSSSTQADVGTEFTYQGYLVDGGTAANGDYDFKFDLYADEYSVSTPIGTITLEEVVVENGIFTVLLDFGGDAFDGQQGWLEIGVRPAVESGDFSTLSGRQAITPVPYALYALKAGQVPWMDVEGRPDGGCTEGSTIQTINPDGSLVCEAHDTRPGFSQTAVDTTGDVGRLTSIAIGVDGLPIISYYFYEGQYHLKVAHCKDIPCSSASISDLGITGVDSSKSTIVIGSDGLPIISYIDTFVYGLKVAHCNDITCTNATLTSIDSDSYCVDASITIGSDGLPILSYYDWEFKILKVAHCDDILCSSAGIATVDNNFGVGYLSNITTGADGLAVIAYIDDLNYDLKVAHCIDIACTSANILTLYNAVNVGGWSHSITIGSDGYPVISYVDVNQTLKIAHCYDLSCTNASINTVDTGASTDVFTSISIGSDGLPVISYFGLSAGLMVAHCADYDCSNASINVVDTGGEIGWYSALALGIDGLPVLSYWDFTNRDLKVTHCSNPFCVPYWTRR